MRKLAFFISLKIILSFTAMTQVNVSFTVDMNNASGFNPEVHQVFLSGARHDAQVGIGPFGVWPMPGSEPGLEMFETGDAGFYSITISNVIPESYAYKYFLVENGIPTWNLGEWGGDPNRIVVVGNSDTTFVNTWGIIGDDSEPDPVINEILASNSSVLDDEDGDSEDWIEIYNRGTSIVNLQGYGLSDDPYNLMRWVFPNVSINPGEYLLVWASGKDRSNPGAPLHTNFSISSAGEPVILTSPEGEIIDLVPEVQHTTDVSFGRLPNGTGEFFYLTQPTPWSMNEGPSYESLLHPVQFSHPDGFYTSEFELTLTSTDAETTIHYTLDGSEPTQDSPVFTLPITIASRAGESNTISMIPTNNNPNPGPPYFEGWQPPVGEVFKINVVRAKAFRPDALSPKTSTYSYMVDDAALTRYSLPIFSIATNNENLFDDDIGIYVHGNHVNFFQDGWERPAHISFWNPYGETQFKEDIGIRLNGNTTRSRPRKALRIIARGQYGNSWINYQLFPNKDTDMFKRFILRNSGNDWDHAIFRDAFFQYLAKDLNVETQYYFPAIVFINGEYWGIHNVRDKYDNRYITGKYGIPPQEFTILSNNAIFRWGNEAGKAHYDSLFDYIEKDSMQINTHYNYVLTQMDVESFIDFQLTHIYVKNTDWPGNNVHFWRYIRDEYSPEEGVKDGRWRWFIHDTDFGFDLPFFYVPGLNDGPAHNTLAFATEPDGPEWPNPPWSTMMLRNLLENNDFRQQFIIRYCDLLNTTFDATHVVSVLDSISDALTPEMQEHIDRWRRPVDIDEWNYNVQVMRDFAMQRVDYQFQHMKDKFGLNDLGQLVVDVSNNAHGYVKLNTMHITSSTMGVSYDPYPWSGSYFQGLPIRFEAIPFEGFEFSHWSGDASGSDNTVTLTMGNGVQVTAHFVETNEELIHFWLFDTSLENDTPLQTIDATFSQLSGARINYHSALEGYPFDETHPDWRKASMERRNSPTQINYREHGNNNIPYSESNMRGLQVRQPFTGDAGENTMFFESPVQGFKNVQFQFAARNEGAADNLLIDYSVTEEENWLSAGLETLTHSLIGSYQLYNVDLTGITTADNNPHLKFRIRFEGDEMDADYGNRVTFNNFSVTGYDLSVHVPDIYSDDTSSFTIFPNPAGNFISVAGVTDVESVLIYDVSGRLVQKAYSSYIDISELQNGMYIVRISFENGKVESGKFVKAQTGN